MKIVYISFESPGNNSGVGKKIESQILEWKHAGHEVQHLVLNTADSDNVNNSTKYLFPKSNINIKPMLAAMLNRGVLRDEIMAYHPDIIYLRHMPWWPGLVNCLKGFKVIQEINGDYRNQFQLLHGMASVKLYLHEFSKDFLNPLTSGLVFVSRELATQYQIEGVPFCIIGNGYRFNDSFEYVRRSNERPQLIHVSSSAYHVWQGIDKILDMGRLFPEMDFHIVVPGFEQCELSNVYCHGKILSENLTSLYKKMDIGIGSLALHRKKMNEASSLKIREYAANGLPIIAGHDDTDISGTPYFLNIGNYENNVYNSIENIRIFINKWIGKQCPYNDVMNRLSYKFKERQRLKFFEEVLNTK